MKRAIVLAVVALALGCKDSGPQDPWVGTWNLVSVDSLAVPATDSINGYEWIITSRRLDLYTGGRGIWMDSSMTRAIGCDLGFGAPPEKKCNASGMAMVAWEAVGDTLTVTRLFGQTTGYVIPVKTFYKQLDGSLLKTDEGAREVYRR